MRHCDIAFNQARASELEDCFDPEIVLYTPDGEYLGCKQVMQYFERSLLQGRARRAFRNDSPGLPQFRRRTLVLRPRQHPKGRQTPRPDGVARCHRVDAK